ncbi:hypothetical protein PFICI_08936 [Pestalotiopsis fici W106-1]|uniref:Uncharacterized protein n=1 Tax=Pestalotiopsis fici (strain W106-1 / CGMCC3.15140) TaxID=1229662 RepID=W3WYY6_PESFW|nr:uncharacterized protein PFICI_08936 [Pestalotiopsis fici W106-1]ETS79083.1 hypothetical protein PFICI_08936 [Pestalotiopsis fici W106-1]
MDDLKGPPKDGKKHSRVSKLTTYARQVFTNLSGAGSNSNAPISQTQSVPEGRDDTPNKTSAASCHEAQGVITEKEISNALHIMRGPVDGVEVGQSLTNLLQNGIKEQYLEQDKKPDDDVDENNKSPRLEGQTQDSLESPTTVPKQRPSSYAFGSSISPPMPKTIKIFDIRRSLSEHNDSGFPRSLYDCANSAPGDLEPKQNPSDDDKETMPSGRMSPGTFLKLASGSKRWVDRPTESNTEVVAKDQPERELRRRPKSPEVTDVPPSEPRETRRPKGLMIQRCEEDGGPMTPVYDLAEISPMQWVSPGIDADRVSRLNPIFVDQYSRMDPVAGEKLKRLKQGLIPETGIPNTAATVKKYDTDVIVDIHGVMEKKRGLTAEADAETDELYASNREREKRIIELREKKQLATYAAWHLQMKREDEEQQQKAEKLSKQTKQQQKSARLKVITSRVGSHLNHQLKEVNYQYDRTMEALEWQRTLMDHHNHTILELEHEIRETCNQVGKDDIDGVYKELLDPAQILVLHQPSAKEMRDSNAPSESGSGRPQPKSQVVMAHPTSSLELQQPEARRNLQPNIQDMENMGSGSASASASTSGNAVQVQPNHPHLVLHEDEGISLSLDDDNGDPYLHYGYEDMSDHGYVSGGDTPVGGVSGANVSGAGVSGANVFGANDDQQEAAVAETRPDKGKGKAVVQEAEETQEPPRVAERSLPQFIPYAGPSNWQTKLGITPKQSIFGPFTDTGNVQERREGPKPDPPIGRYMFKLRGIGGFRNFMYMRPFKVRKGRKIPPGLKTQSAAAYEKTQYFSEEDCWMSDDIWYNLLCGIERERPYLPHDLTSEEIEALELASTEFWEASSGKLGDLYSPNAFLYQKRRIEAAQRAFIDEANRIKARRETQAQQTEEHDSYCCCDNCILQNVGSGLGASTTSTTTQTRQSLRARTLDTLYRGVDSTTNATSPAAPRRRTVVMFPPQQPAAQTGQQADSSAPAYVQHFVAPETSYYDTGALDTHWEEEEDEGETGATQAATTDALATASVEHVDPSQDEDDMQFFLEDYIGFDDDDDEEDGDDDF